MWRQGSDGCGWSGCGGCGWSDELTRLRCLSKARRVPTHSPLTPAQCLTSTLTLPPLLRQRCTRASGPAWGAVYTESKCVFGYRAARPYQHSHSMTARTDLIFFGPFAGSHLLSISSSVSCAAPLGAGVAGGRTVPLMMDAYVSRLSQGCT